MNMKPSEILTVRSKRTWLLLPSFKGITWMGVVYCRKQKYIDEINKSDNIDSSFKSHETIHVRQAQSMNDSWFRFYFNYCLQYIKNLPFIFINLYAPYKLIPTEIEAYLNQDNWKYAEKIEPVYQWKLFQKLKFKDKRQIAKAYYASGNRKKYDVILKEYIENNKIYNI